MALGIYFAARSNTTEQYDEAIRRLEAAGEGAPEGRSYHCAFVLGGAVHVFDVWESQEAFDAFGQTLMPVGRNRRHASTRRPTHASIHCLPCRASPTRRTPSSRRSTRRSPSTTG